MPNVTRPSGSDFSEVCQEGWSRTRGRDQHADPYNLRGSSGMLPGAWDGSLSGEFDESAVSSKWLPIVRRPPFGPVRRWNDTYKTI
jgi:hypothetical protein